MFDKFEARIKEAGVNWMSLYAQLSQKYRRHHARFERYIDDHGLSCQACGGAGNYIEDVIPEVGTVYGTCGFCEGTGLVTRWMRGQWLRWKKDEKSGDRYRRDQ